jgi:hypothetical protein
VVNAGADVEDVATALVAADLMHKADALQGSEVMLRRRNVRIGHHDVSVGEVVRERMERVVVAVADDCNRMVWVNGLDELVHSPHNAGVEAILRPVGLIGSGASGAARQRGHI